MREEMLPSGAASVRSGSSKWSGPPLALRSWERGVLRTVQCAAQRWVLNVFLVILGLYLLGRVVAHASRAANAAAASDESGPTLNDPNRLQRTLTQFAAVPPVVGAGDRHRTEGLCRSLLESMLGFPLPKVRPKWLRNPTTRRSLELDMYNEAHRIAFEYDGAQHDHYTPHFHQNEHHFEYRQLLDRLKTELCREKGVLLIRIPWYEVSGSDRVRTARFLEQLLRSHGLPYRSVLRPVD